MVVRIIPITIKCLTCSLWCISSTNKKKDFWLCLLTEIYKVIKTNYARGYYEEKKNTIAFIISVNVITSGLFK